MRPAIQLVPTGVPGTLDGARRWRECPPYRLPDVRELPLRLEPVAPDTFGGLMSMRSRTHPLPHDQTPADRRRR
jgi:hypothetical protein